MNYQEIKKYLQYNENESKVYMPNEIFEDLQNNMKKTVHIPVAYSYYYLVTWLYRHAKYYNIPIDNKKMKEILGYSPSYPEIDYIFKKNGLLDVMGYTETVKDYPVLWTFEDNFLEFEMLSEYDEYTQKVHKETRSRKYTIKYPVKAFERVIAHGEDTLELEGTFYDVENTHLIPFEVFMYCMNNKDIGCTGFYLYSYLKMKNQIFTNGYDVAMDKLAEQVGLPIKTMKDSLKQLRQFKMVEGIQNMEFFCTALEDYKRKANTYITNEIESFTDKPVDYEKIKVMTTGEYKKIQEEEFERLYGGELVDIPLEELPF